LNKYLQPNHFKMEHLLTFLPHIKKGFLMTSLDLKDAYFTLPIAEPFRKFLCFTWRDQIYEFRCLCFGLSPAPLYFTKVMKPVFGSLRREGVCCSYYIDDSIYANGSGAVLQQQTERASDLLQSLGFVVNWEKSSLTPSTVITHLGFVIDSEQMMVFLPINKVAGIKAACQSLLQHKSPTVRLLAKVIGLIVSSFLAVLHGPLHYRQLERLKTDFLTECPDYDSRVVLTDVSRDELKWWRDNVETNNGRHIEDILGIRQSAFELFTDSSKIGWGAVLVYDGKTLAECAGQWSHSEAKKHINILELQAIFLGMKALEKYLPTPGHLCINCDNTTAISYVNKYGGIHTPELDSLAHEIWNWCIPRNIMITAVHIPGIRNVRADALSRQFNESVEWSLNLEVFNNKLEKYFSWRPDPGSIAVNALSQSWEGLYGYAFPPFNLVGRVLTKVEQAECMVLLVCPLWHTQPWFPHLTDLLIDYPVILPSDPFLLSCPFNPDRRHPLATLKLMACLLSKDVSRQLNFRKRLQISSRQAGNPQQQRTTHPSSESGLAFAKDGIWITPRLI